MSSLLVPGAVAAPQISSFQLSSVMMSISSFARYLAEEFSTKWSAVFKDERLDVHKLSYPHRTFSEADSRCSSVLREPHDQSDDMV